jgi:hypothetical protein
MGRPVGELIKKTILKPSKHARLPGWIIFFLVSGLALLVLSVRPGGKLGLSLEGLLDPDWFIRARVLLGAEPPDRLPITIFDIDDATFREWDQPPTTPRPRLVSLIEAAARRQAAAIVVDIDMTYAASVADLDASIAYLASYAHRDPAPPLLLMRRLWYQAGDTGLGRPTTVSVPTYGSAQKNELAGRLAMLEALVEKSPNLIWSSPLHLLDNDGILRFWRPAEALCNPAAEGKPRAFLAVPVIVAALTRTADASSRFGDLVRLKQATEQHAARFCSAQSGMPDRSLSGDWLLRLLSDPENKRRIPFTFWRKIADPASAGEGQDMAGRKVPVAAVLSAREVLAADSAVSTQGQFTSFCEQIAGGPFSGNPPLSCDVARDRVVLIGTTHVDARDSYATPLGQMFGVDILANSAMGSRLVSEQEKVWIDNMTFLAALLFVVLAFIGVRLATLPATVAIAATLLLFGIASGYFGIDAATSYEAIANSLLTFATFLALAGVAGYLLKYVRMRRLRGGYAPVAGIPAEPSQKLAKSRTARQRTMLIGAALAVQSAGEMASVPAASAQGLPRVVGVVQRIDGWKPDSAGGRIERSGMAERSIILGEYVYEGDRVRVPGADATIVIARQRGALTICPKGARSEECLAIVDGKGGYLQAVAQFAGSLDKIVSWYGTAATVNLTTRSGNAPQILVGAGKPQKIEAGERRLWLSWSGGSAPFTLRVTQPGTTAVEIPSTTTEIDTPVLRLNNGTASIEVVDSRGRTAKLSAKVIARMPIPPVLTGAAPTPLIERYLATGWLSMQDDGSYLLEAASRLSPLAAELPAAWALRAALAAGERPRQ